MCMIKLKVCEGNKTVDLEMADFDKGTLKFVLKQVFGKQELQLEEEPQVEEDSQVEEESENPWSWHENKVVGLHHPVSEFNAPASNEVAAAVVEEDFERKQCWYICECGHKGRHFIPDSRDFVTCVRCQEHMMVRWANPRGPQYQDERGNYYIAGEYKKTMKDREDEKLFWEQKNKEKELLHS